MNKKFVITLICSLFAFKVFGYEKFNLNDIDPSENIIVEDLYEPLEVTGDALPWQLFGKTKEIEDRFKDHSVFVGYAPLDNPKYIASVIIENGGSGSAVAAPIAHKALNFAHSLNV